MAVSLEGRLAIAGVHSETLPNGIATMQYHLHPTAAELAALLAVVKRVDGVQQAFVVCGQ